MSTTSLLLYLNVTALCALTSFLYDSGLRFPLLFIIMFPAILGWLIYAVTFLLQKLDFMSERILSLGFDVISHVMETGPVSFIIVGFIFAGSN